MTMRFHLVVVQLLGVFAASVSSFSVGNTNTVSSGSVPKIEESACKKWKDELLHLIRTGDDDVLQSPIIEPAVEALEKIYKERNIDARFSKNPAYNGCWEDVRPIRFPGCLGTNEEGYPLYTVERVTFNNIPSAKDVVVAIDGMPQHLDFVEEGAKIPGDVPDHLKEAVEANPSEVRYQFLDSHFTVEENGLKGILRMCSYVFPSPTEENKFDSWHVGGKCLARPNQDKKLWDETFGGDLSNQQESSMSKMTSLIEDESLSYDLKKPVPVFSKTLYLDEDLRITRGNFGTMMFNVRGNAER